jgi:hypothetical protein
MINPNAAIDIYDDTVSLSFFATKAIKGLVKFLCLKDSLSNLRSRFTQLADYYKFWHQSPRNVHHKMRITKNSFCEIISSYSPEVRIGLKVDIEGSEWEILEQLAQNKSRFEFVLIEIHHFEDHEIELREFLATLDNDFVLAYLHANNFEHVGRNGFPRVFELTLLRKANARATGGNRQTLPVPNLDVPISKNRPDFQISFD